MKVVFNSVSSALAEADAKDKEVEESLSVFGKKGKGKGYRTATYPSGDIRDEYDEPEEEEDSGVNMQYIKRVFLNKHKNTEDDRLLQIICQNALPSMFNRKKQRRTAKTRNRGPITEIQADDILDLLDEVLENIHKVMDDASDKASSILK